MAIQDIVDYREPEHVVWGAATYLLTLQIPTSAPGTPLAGNVYLRGNNLTFFSDQEYQVLTQTSSFAGDVSGTQSALHVTGLQGIPLVSGTPTGGYALTYDAIHNQLVYSDVENGGATLVADETSRAEGVEAQLQANINAEVSRAISYENTIASNLAAEAAARLAGDTLSQTLPLSGDLSGSLPSPTIAKLNGVVLNTTAPVDGQFLKYNATAGKAQWTSPSEFCGTFLASNFISTGDGTGNLQVSFSHGLTMVGSKLPQVHVYENVSGAMLSVGGIAIEVTSTQVILTVAPNAAFTGQVDLLYI